jgi:NDP-4-keto-2,6-dideoxyhexose 3-C-methyltransferase
VSYTTRKNCRVCQGSFADVLYLGNLYLSAFLEEGQTGEKAPLDLVRCTDCDLYQLRHTVDQDSMYQEYWYQSGLNRSMVAALENVYECVKQRVNLKHEDVVVDIGANDGTLLSFYKDGCYRVAFEPSNIANKIQAEHISNTYFSAKEYRKQRLPLAKVITAIAMFYDLENPRPFVKDMRDILAHDGVIIVQMMDLMSMFKVGDFSNICHEHLVYYSLSDLVSLFENYDLEVFDLEYNQVNGGSLRIYARHDNRNTLKREDVVEKALEEEFDYFTSLGDPDMYFRTRAEKTKEKIVNYVHKIIADDESIGVIGDSTKGNTFLQYFGLSNNEISLALEVNPDKFGRKTTGTNIPIVNEGEIGLLPDNLLILPWGFTNFLLRRYKSYLEDGGKIISPLPQPRLFQMAMNGENEVITEVLL